MGWQGELEVRWPDSEAGALDSPDLSPTLIRPAQVYLPDLLGDTLVDVWPRDLNTAEMIGGREAAARAEKARARSDREYESLKGSRMPSQHPHRARL